MNTPAAMNTLASINGGELVPAELTVETEQIEVTLSRKVEPNLTWTYTDVNGHFHAYDKDGKLPTLTARTEHRGCDMGHDDDCEGYDVTVYECAICGEQVEPAVRVIEPGPREFIPGPTNWTVRALVDTSADRVSVRLTSGAPLDRVELFGIAAAIRRDIEGGPAGVRVWTTFAGAGPLGERKATR